MAYIDKPTGEYPLSEQDIRMRYPNTNFPIPFKPDDRFAWVFPTSLPPYSYLTQTYRELAPAMNAKGFYEQRWEIIDLPGDMADEAKARIQAAQWESIKAERDRRTLGGVKTGGNWYHSDTFSRTQQIGLVMMGSNMPAGIMWKTMDQTFVPMTPLLAQQIFQAVAGSDATLFATAEAKRLEMLTLDDPTRYDVMAGWPVTHGEE